MSTCRTVQPRVVGRVAPRPLREGELAPAHRVPGASGRVARTCTAAPSWPRKPNSGWRLADLLELEQGGAVGLGVDQRRGDEVAERPHAVDVDRPRGRPGRRAASAPRASNRRGSGSAPPQRPSGRWSGPSWAWLNWPASARASTTASRCAADQAEVAARGEHPGQMRPGCAAGSSTTSSVPWQQTRSSGRSPPSEVGEGVGVALERGDALGDAASRRCAGTARRARRGWGRRR